MDSNKKSILAFVKKHKNEIMLDSCGRLVKLVGFVDGEDDYYYRLEILSHQYLATNLLESCVGWMYPLKGRLPKREYENLVQFFNLNTNHAKIGHERENHTSSQ